MDEPASEPVGNGGDAKPAVAPRAAGNHTARLSQVQGPSGGYNDGPNCLVFDRSDMGTLSNVTFTATWDHDTFTQLLLRTSAGDRPQVAGASPLEIQAPTMTTDGRFSLSIQPPEPAGAYYDVEVTISWSFEHESANALLPDEVGGC